MQNFNQRVLINFFSSLIFICGFIGIYCYFQFSPVLISDSNLTAKTEQVNLTRLTADQAISKAINRLQETDEGYVLNNPQYCATFTTAGLTFYPSQSDLNWHWQIQEAGDLISGYSDGNVQPEKDNSGDIIYNRGKIYEKYVINQNSIEQQFVVPEKPQIENKDLVIEGSISSNGKFNSDKEGWNWQNSNSKINLGDVTVFDADGEELIAEMQVTPNTSQIIVAAADLAQATYPVTIDPEINTEQFRISAMGADLTADAESPEIAYNSIQNEYLVVWHGDDQTGIPDDKNEIWGQLLDANSGDFKGQEIRISFTEPQNDQDFKAVRPDIAYNSTDDQYLIVWAGSVNSGDGGEYEIWGQRMQGGSGLLIGNQFQISEQGPANNIYYDADRPAVAYNNIDNEYMVIWNGVANANGRFSSEWEIYGQRLGATGNEIGGDFRISNMGNDANPDFDAFYPAIAFNPTINGYMVVWHGDDTVDGEYEIYGTQVSNLGVVQLGQHNRISEMGPDGNSNYDANIPAIVYNSVADEYLVVWHGDNTNNDEFEIYGQKLEGASGLEIGNDIRISNMGSNSSSLYGAFEPDVSFDEIGNEYFIAWYGDENNAPLVNDELEIFCQRLDGTTLSPMDAMARLSDMGPDGSVDFRAIGPKIAHNNSLNQYTVIWVGDDNSFGLADDEFEIFGQQINAANGQEIGMDFRISDMTNATVGLYRAENSDVAFNSTNNEYLVVWSGDDNLNGLVDGEYEIYGQRIGAITGSLIGDIIRISNMGPDGNDDYDAYNPAIIFNNSDNEYLVVWSGDDNLNGLVDGEREIFGQRIDAASGIEIGGDFRISNMGPDGDTDYDGFNPAVTFNSINNEYLVVWYGDDDTPPLIDGEREVFGQRINATTGIEIGGDFRISDMGPDGDTNYDAGTPDVIYSAMNNEYYVVWHGDDNTPPLNEGEHEIFGQRINAATGAEIGADFRISNMGPDGNSAYGAFNSVLEYNNTDNEYLVVWYGDDVASEYEIYGQRIDASTGNEIGSDFRISEMGPDGNTDYYAYTPAISYNNLNNQYLVSWHGINNIIGLALDETEIYGQWLDGGNASEIGTDFRISFMGPDGDGNYDAFYSALAFNSNDNNFLAVWQGYDNAFGIDEDEEEIFGCFLEADSIASAITERAGQIPGAFSLQQNYPNPFNPSTTITFSVPQSGKVTLHIYNTLGQLVETLIDREIQRGTHNITWNGGHLPSGIYYYTMHTAGYQAAQRMLLLK